jgi:hypothetical protein
MDERAESKETDAPSGSIFTPHRRTQAVVTIVSVLCIFMFWQAASWLGIPPVPKVDGSLLAQPQWPQAVLATYVLILVAVVVGTVLAGWSWFFAGLFTMSVGLVTLAVRCGATHFVLFDAASRGQARSIFIRLLFEQCLLFLAIATVWVFLWRKFLALLPKSQSEDEHKEHAFSWIGAVAAQVIASGALVLLLTPTDAKKQVLLSVFAGTLLGSMLAEYLSPSRRAVIWYWLGPFIVGAVGYIAAYIHAVPWTVGTASGTLAPLAHPLPLDYAGAGTMGALLGYWVSGERPHVPFTFRRARSDNAENSSPAVKPERS